MHQALNSVTKQNSIMHNQLEVNAKQFSAMLANMELFHDLANNSQRIAERLSRLNKRMDERNYIGLFQSYWAMLLAKF